MHCLQSCSPALPLALFCALHKIVVDIPESGERNCVRSLCVTIVKSMATTTTRRTPQQGTQTNLFAHFLFLSITKHSYDYLSQRQSTSSSSASCHTVLTFIVPVILTFLQIKYQGKTDTTPFDTYPKSLGVSITSLLFYCFTYYAELESSSYEHLRRCQTYARHGTVVFGWLSLVSLVSTLLLDSVGSLLCLLYILFFAGKFLPRQFLMLWSWLHQIVLGRVPVMLPSWLTTLSRLATAYAFSNSRRNNL
ncbi:hypothetical protein ACSBR1_010262 [Camellia fascicularis]